MILTIVIRWDHLMGSVYECAEKVPINLRYIIAQGHCNSFRRISFFFLAVIRFIVDFDLNYFIPFRAFICAEAGS